MSNHGEYGTMRVPSGFSTFDREGFFLLLVGYVCFSMFGATLGVALPELMLEFSISETQAGLLYSASLLSTAVLLIPSGYLADRFGHKTLLISGYLLLAIGVTAMSSSGGYLEFLVALVVAGGGAGLLIPSYYTMVGEALTRTRGFAIGFAAGAYHLGGSIGSVLLGFFVSQQRWRFAYYVMAIILFLVMMIQYVRVAPPPTRTRSDGGSNLYSSLMAIMTERNSVISSIMFFLANIGFSSACAWLPTFFFSFTGLDTASVGLVFGPFLLAGLVAQPAIGALSDRIRRSRIACTSGIASAVLSVPMLMTHYSFWASIGYSVLFGLLLFPFWNLLITIAQESVRKESRASATGIIQTFGLVGSALGPIMAGNLMAVAGINRALVCSITVPVLIYGVLALAILETSRNVTGAVQNSVDKQELHESFSTQSGIS